jgi:hypothetical protein
MALYEDGKIKFTDEWIESITPDEDLREFLRIKRYNLVDRKNSPYCTIENLIYNFPIHEIRSDLYWFLMGKKNATVKSCIKMQVESIAESYELIKKLEEIEKHMEEENNWGE